jgi:hypothetical protein
MRLINVQKLELEVFYDEQIPPYAILSHTWGEHEIVFSDMMPAPSAETKAKTQFEKIRMSADIALQNNLQYIWIGK